MQDAGTSITRSLAATRGGTERALRAIRQLIEPRGRLIALATLAILSFATPAAAQSGSEAVVCVGSERRTLATNPIRRVYTEDMEIVYPIGADIDQRDQVERDLSSDLDSYPEVWCAWSDPGDNHAGIISYTGVIRQDLTVDPDDPRFQALSVGFSTDFDAAAEAQAADLAEGRGEVMWSWKRWKRDRFWIVSNLQRGVRDKLRRGDKPKGRRETSTSEPRTTSAGSGCR